MVAGLVQGHLIGRMARDVRDYMPNAESPAANTHAAVVTKRYGELWVPEATGYLQQMKVGGKEDEELVVQEIVASFFRSPGAVSRQSLSAGAGQH